MQKTMEFLKIDQGFVIGIRKDLGRCVNDDDDLIMDSYLNQQMTIQFNRCLIRFIDKNLNMVENKEIPSNPTFGKGT